MVTSSPEFTKPVQTPPFLTLLSPDSYTFQSVESLGASPLGWKTQNIGASVVSEDLGEPLEAVLVQDWLGSGHPESPPTILKDITIAAGHLTDGPRKVAEGDQQGMEFSFANTIQPGCHSVTLIVTHQFIGRTLSPKVGSDVDSATWWYEIGADQPNAIPCPAESPPHPDGGTDAAPDASGVLN